MARQPRAWYFVPVTMTSQFSGISSKYLMFSLTLRPALPGDLDYQWVFSAIASAEDNTLSDFYYIQCTCTSGYYCSSMSTVASMGVQRVYPVIQFNSHSMGMYGAADLVTCTASRDDCRRIEIKPLPNPRIRPAVCWR